MNFLERIKQQQALQEILKPTSKGRQGFTLIEIMVAIAIVAILATIGIQTYSQTQMRARDLRRKQDLRAIADSLKLYYQFNKRYPCTTTGLHSNGGTNWITDSTGCGNAATAPFDSRYISVLPKDPTGNTSVFADNTDSYTYFYNTPAVNGSGCPTLPSGATGNAQYFTLRAHLENSNDGERCEVQRYARCDGASFCPSPSPGSAASRVFAVSSQ